MGEAENIKLNNIHVHLVNVICVKVILLAECEVVWKRKVGQARMYMY